MHREGSASVVFHEHWLGKHDYWSVWLLMWFLIFQDAPPGILDFLELHHFRYTWFCSYALQNGWMDTANYNSINMSESLLSQPCHQLLMFSALLFSFFFNFSPSFLLFFLIPQYLFHIKLLLLINYQQVNTFILKFSPAFVTAHISRTNISCKIGKQVKPQVNLLLHRKNQDFIISFIRCPYY